MGLLSWILAFSMTLQAGAGTSARTDEPTEEDRYRRWLEEVQPIMLAPELALFLQLEHDYERDAFIQKFWRVRDPYPRTGRNELRERYDERIGFARGHYDTMLDDRSRILAVHGFPSQRVEIRCGRARVPAEIWAFNHSRVAQLGFVLVFFSGRNGAEPAKLWRPSQGPGADPFIRGVRNCHNGATLVEVARQLTALGSEYDAILNRVLQKPRPPSIEWVAAFRANTTRLPEEAERFPAELEVAYLGSHQNRTVVQGALVVRQEDLAIGSFLGHRSRDLRLLGEVITGGARLETFRYKFGVPAEQSTRVFTFPFQRFLRPGRHRLVVLAEDLNGHRFARLERTLEVPRLDHDFEAPERRSAILAGFEEAAAAAARGDNSIRIVPPKEGVLTGLVRFGTLVVGDDTDTVRFSLDDTAILEKRRAPYSVELDLGAVPKLRHLRVEALDAGGRVVAWDEVEINGEGPGLRVRLESPRSGARVERSVLVQVDLGVPEGGLVDRVELFVDETPVATLFQEPWQHPVQLPRPGQLAYLRAVAHLVDGTTAEDLAFVNTPGEIDAVKVQLVEVYASVSDGGGRPALDLERDDFKVEEDGAEQEILRFERVRSLPIHVAVLLDNSASMRGSLDTAREAAVRFFERAIGAQDQAAVITFNRFPAVSVPLTNDHRSLGGGLAGLSAEGQTALYDSVMFGLYYMAGISGQRALLLMTDGRDETSRFSFDETLDYARRAGVTVYPVGLAIADPATRRRLSSLARETGGESFYIRTVDELEAVYGRIERELRGQYLLTYQSSNQGDTFRQVEVKVRRSGMRVRAMSGYYP